MKKQQENTTTEKKYLTEEEIKTILNYLTELAGELYIAKSLFSEEKFEGHLGSDKRMAFRKVAKRFSPMIRSLHKVRNTVNVAYHEIPPERRIPGFCCRPADQTDEYYVGLIEDYDDASADEVLL